MVNVGWLKISVTVAIILCTVQQAISLPTPTQCRSCTTEACNTTADDVIGNNTEQTNRTKRESSVEYRSCNQLEAQFQLEIVFIPLAIAMIPVGLLALLLCVFCCGPKESRGKMPEKFSTKRKTVEQTPESSEIDGIELVCKDGIVMRNDSKKTRFSTAIYFIESRRVSIDIIDDTGSPVSMQPNAKDIIDENKFRSVQDTGIVQQQTTTEQQLDNVSEGNEENLPRRTTSSKKTRFAENVDIIGETVSTPQKLLLKEQA